MTDFMGNRPLKITRASPTFDPTKGMHNAELVVLDNLLGSIQLKRESGGAQAQGFPAPTTADAVQPIWDIYILGDFNPGDIQKNDKVTATDTGDTYQVEAPAWSPLGYRIAARSYKP